MWTDFNQLSVRAQPHPLSRCFKPTRVKLIIRLANKPSRPDGRYLQQPASLTNWVSEPAVLVTTALPRPLSSWGEGFRLHTPTPKPNTRSQHYVLSWLFVGGEHYAV